MERIDVLKTYKLFIGGQFPRTESGRYYKVFNSKDETIANACLASRKDFKDAVVSARKAFETWQGKTAFNRSQIIYRIAEILEGRKDQFISELMQQATSRRQAQLEVNAAIDRCIYYAGWCDKYQQIFSSVNPVSTPHFNFSVPEPMGVVSIIAPEDSALLGLLSIILPCIAGGNTCVVLSSYQKPLCAISLAEVFATSDVPGGVVNILTGSSSELHSHMSSHMDVNAVVYCRENFEELRNIQANSATNVKRNFHWHRKWSKQEAADPYLILDLQETKTTWHPIENIGASGGKY